MYNEYQELDGIISDDEVILLKPPIPVSKKLCKCWNCSFYAHTDPPSHFCELDEGYCCSWCRLSNGKKHGNHCQRIKKKKKKKKRNE